MNQTSRTVRTVTHSCRCVCGPDTTIQILYSVAQVRHDLSVACECSAGLVLGHVSTSPSLQETKCHSRVTGHFIFIYGLFNGATGSPLPGQTEKYHEIRQSGYRSPG